MKKETTSKEKKPKEKKPKKLLVLLTDTALEPCHGDVGLLQALSRVYYDAQKTRISITNRKPGPVTVASLKESFDDLATNIFQWLTDNEFFDDAVPGKPNSKNFVISDKKDTSKSKKNMALLPEAIAKLEKAWPEQADTLDKILVATYKKYHTAQLNPAALRVLDAFAKDSIKIEENMKKTIAAELGYHKIYIDFLQSQKGCGPIMSAMLISEIKDISWFKNPSHLWSYAGYSVNLLSRCTKCGHVSAVRDFADGSCPKCHSNNVEETGTGRAVRREKGHQSNWNSHLKTKLYVLAGCLLKSGNPTYTKIYRDYKNRLENRDCTMPPERHNDEGKVDAHGCTKGHRQNMAMRYMIKMFLLDLDIAWRKSSGLPPTQTYQEAKLNKKHGEDYDQDNGASAAPVRK